MPQATITSGIYFGNNALPNGQGVLPWINLNNGLAAGGWNLRDFQADGTNRQMGIAQLPFRGKGVYLSDDWGAKSVVIPVQFYEITAGSFAAAKAALLMAGEQYLTLDNKVTGALAKVKSIGVPKIIHWDATRILYELSLEFALVREPWFSDLLPMGTVSGNSNILFGKIEDAQSSFEAPGVTATLWHSLGTEAGTDNSIAYWTTDAGAPSYSLHVVSLPNGAQIRGGHPDTTDCTYRQRVTTAAAFSTQIQVHSSSFSSYITAYLQVGAGTGVLNLAKNTGVFTGIASAGSLTIAASTAYWLEIVATGTTYKANAYADSAGAIGALIATCTGTITDATLQSGQVGLRNDQVGTPTAGGAFANVCTVTGPWPAIGINNWSIGQGTGEAAFCWSKVSPDSGAYSLSIYNAIAAGQGFSVQTIPHVIGATYTISSRVKGTGSPTNLFVLYGGNVPANVTADGTWRDCIQTQLYSVGGWPDQISCVAFGQGTFYFDGVVLSRQISDQAGVPYYGQPAVDQIALAGSVSPGSATSWSWTYPGSVRSEPLFQLNIPNTNTVVINSLVLKNNMTGETLTITFGPPLAANTAWTITIDCAAYTVTDNLGNAHDISGSFLTLQPPAGQVQSFTATLITASGTSSGVTLDSRWFNKWEI